MELIDREKLLKELKTSADHHEENSRDYVLMLRDRNIVREQPTVEAVPMSVLEDIMAEIRQKKAYRGDPSESFGMELAIDIIDKHMSGKE